MSFSELQTVMYEAANLVNERPIGHDDSRYLSPNHLLMGRATSRVPGGPFRDATDLRKRFEHVQKLIDNFWKRWITYYFPSLLVRQKWHVERRNVRVDDVVLVQDSNAIRGKWKLGRVTTVYPGKDGRVRSVEIGYKNPKPDERMDNYTGQRFTVVERPVQKIVVIIPAEDQNG